MEPGKSRGIIYTSESKEKTGKLKLYPSFLGEIQLSVTPLF